MENYMNLNVKQVLDLQTGDKVRYRLAKPDPYLRGKLIATIRGIRPVGPHFNVLMEVNGYNVVQNTSNYGRSWILNNNL